MSYFVAVFFLALSAFHLFHIHSFKGAVFLSILSLGTLVYYYGRELLKGRNK